MEEDKAGDTHPNIFSASLASHDWLSISPLSAWRGKDWWWLRGGGGGGLRERPLAD